MHRNTTIRIKVSFLYIFINEILKQLTKTFVFITMNSLFISILDIQNCIKYHKRAIIAYQL